MLGGVLAHFPPEPPSCPAGTNPEAAAPQQHRRHQAPHGRRPHAARWYYRVFQSAPDLIRPLLPDSATPGDRLYRFKALEIKAARLRRRSLLRRSGLSRLPGIRGTRACSSRRRRNRRCTGYWCAGWASWCGRCRPVPLSLDLLAVGRDIRYRSHLCFAAV